MHGPATILIMAKKKAAGPMGFFDPMAEHGDMAMGPMDMEAPAGGMFDSGVGAMPGGEASSGSIQEALMHLRKAAQVLEGCGPEEAAEEAAEGPEMEEETTEEVPMPAPKAKKPAPAFLKPKPMKY